MKKCLKTLRLYGRRSLAAIGAGFMPFASYRIVHFEMDREPRLGVLVAFCLLYSAPTLCAWAKDWIGKNRNPAYNRLLWAKAIGFCVLLEGVLVCSKQDILVLIALGLLVLINVNAAWRTCK